MRNLHEKDGYHGTIKKIDEYYLLAADDDAIIENALSEK